MKRTLKQTVSYMLAATLILTAFAFPLPAFANEQDATDIPVELLYIEDENDAPEDIEITEDMEEAQEPETVDEYADLSDENEEGSFEERLEEFDDEDISEIVEDADPEEDADHAADDPEEDADLDTDADPEEDSAGVIQYHEAKSLDSKSDKELYNHWTNQGKPEGFTPKETSIDPYGYGYNVPFYMNKTSNIAVYATNNMYENKTTNRYIKSFALDKGVGSGYVFTGAQEKQSYEIPMADVNGTPKLAKELNYVRMTAFDPTGSGRKDHLAVIGVHNETEGTKEADKKLYLYVYNRDGSVVSDIVSLGNMNWMGEENTSSGDFDNDNCWFFNSSNFLGITAGDYDGDKKDTLVIWGSFDRGQKDNGYDGSLYGLKEVGVTENNNQIDLNVGATSNALLHDIYTYSGGTLQNTTYVEDKLCCAINTCDVNGDRIDDLQVLSYVDVLTEGEQGRHQTTQMYRPYLTVSYGKKGEGNFSILKDDPDVTVEVMGDKDGDYIPSCMAAGLSAGDIDGDGLNEIVVAGMKNRIKGKKRQPADTPYNFDKEKTVVAIYACEGDSATRVYFDEQDANKWTYSGLFPTTGTGSDDRVMQQYSVKCVAINGVGNPSLIFINGDLYGWNESTLDRVYRPDYFSDSRMIPGSVDASNTLIVSADVGNFNGNKYGHEQVICSIGLKTSEHERYFMAPFIIGGDFDNVPESGITDEYFCTGTGILTSGGDTMEEVFFPKKNDEQSKNGGSLSEDYNHAHLTQNHGLNYCLCAIDNSEENSGLLVRFHEKGYVYTDPDVMCVLQAVPSYEELEDFEKDESVTIYSTLNSVSYEDSTENEVAFGAGVTAGVETPAGGFDFKAGYSQKWGQEFSEKFSEETGYTYKSTGSDAVVMTRTPVTIYVYQVMNNQGQWGTTKDDYIALSFPGTPETGMLSVERYNEFVKYYNKTNNNKATLPQLVDTDKKKLYLNTDRDPARYINSSRIPGDVKVIMKTANAFDVGTGSTGFDYKTEHETSSADSVTRGFSFEFSVKVKAGLPGIVEASAGAYASLEEMNKSTHTTTRTDAIGIGCDVENAERNKMLKAGFTEESADRYGFSYKMAQWDSPIVKKVGHRIPETGKVVYEDVTVPIIGYVLSNVRKPVYASINAPKDLTLKYGYSKTSTGKFTATGDPDPSLGKVSGNEKITFDKTTGKLTVAKGLDAGTYKVQMRAANGIPGREANRTYTVKVNKISINDAKVVLDRNEYTYDGKTHRPKIKTIGKKSLKSGTDYTVKWSSTPKKAGKYTMTITGKGNYTGKTTAKFSIVRAANKATKVTSSKSISYDRLKNKSQTFTISATVKEKAAKTFALSSVPKSAKGYITVSKKGKVKVSKGLKKGAYKIKVKITAAKTANYKKTTVTKTITIKVK